jgi:hypothetical protein
MQMSSLQQLHCHHKELVTMRFLLKKIASLPTLDLIECLINKRMKWNNLSKQCWQIILPGQAIALIIALPY